MDDKRIEEIEARLKAIGSGEWIETTTDDGVAMVIVVSSNRCVHMIGDLEDTDRQDHLDANFIAHAPSDIAYLLERVHRLTYSDNRNLPG